MPVDGCSARDNTMSGSADLWRKQNRLGGLRRFALAISVLNILGHSYLGFEQSWAQPLVALVVAYSVELVIELLVARSESRPPVFLQSTGRFVDFLLPAHISGLACAMLLYSNDRLGPIAFAACVAITSKHLIRMNDRGRDTHVFNPSNFGIATTLLLFPWVGIAQPYQFTESTDSLGDVLLPLFIICSGTFLNYSFTKRLPLVGSWLAGFVLQAVLRYFVLGASLRASLLPMTGVVFILFTFYMVTDPPTTPSSVSGQVGFGLSVALIYGLLICAHHVFGLFFALVITTSVRGVVVWGRRSIAMVSVGPHLS